MPKFQSRYCCNWSNHLNSFNFLLQPPVRYWQESPKDATNENTAEKDDPKSDPLQTLPKQQKNKKKAEKAKKRKQDEEQPDEKTFLSGVRMTIYPKLVFNRALNSISRMPKRIWNWLLDCIYLVIRKWIHFPGQLLFQKTEWKSSGGKIKLKR